VDHAAVPDKTGPVNLGDALASFADIYSPRIVGRVNDYDVRIAHAKGDHVWHVHEHTDEFFLVLEGRFDVSLRDPGGRERTVVLQKGEMFVVAKGTHHKPSSPGGAILMFEPGGTSSTGDRHEGEIPDHVESTTGRYISLPDAGPSLPGPGPSLAGASSSLAGASSSLAGASPEANVEGLARASSRVAEELRRLGATAEVREMPESTRTASEAAAALGCAVAQIVKSLVFRSVVSDEPVLVLVSGADRVDEGLLAQVVGEAVEQATGKFVRERTGYAIGGVPPVGHAQPVVTYLDGHLLDHALVWAAAGTPRAVFSIAPADLVRITSARVVAVARA
jgi:prolyl-tRNA editing enzyme YbaK/EbsC (Cys-tRNA(Pro) deacylase)/mannose-6-phosphate isomerase-like protein (cupin superfamily)